MAPDVPLMSGVWILRSRTDAPGGRIPAAKGNQNPFDGLQYAVGVERTVGAFHKNHQVFRRVDSVEMIEPHGFLVAFSVGFLLEHAVIFQIIVQPGCNRNGKIGVFCPAAMSAAMFPAGFRTWFPARFPARLSTGRHPHKECLRASKLSAGFGRFRQMLA